MVWLAAGGELLELGREAAKAMNIKSITVHDRNVAPLPSSAAVSTLRTSWSSQCSIRLLQDESQIYPELRKKAL